MDVSVVGLGPGSLDRVPGRTMRLLTDPHRTVVVRTLRHPAAEELAAQRPVTSCDDLYEAASSHTEVYERVVDRILRLAADGPVTYAVPGSPLVGETAVGLLRARMGEALEVVPAESFIDVALAATGVDPLHDGLQVLDAQDLPHQLVLQVPTLIGHLTLGPLVDEVRDRLLVVLTPDTTVTLLTDLGDDDARVEAMPLADLRAAHAGLRVSLLVRPVRSGLIGAVETMRHLREACPWDAEQTHRSILPNLVEETFELHEALLAVGADVPGSGEPDWGAYADAEEELGDVLLQVLFHAVMAEETGGFSLESAATELRHKLERRHPHVFGDAESDEHGDVVSAEDTFARWEAIKATEQNDRHSLMDGVPTGMPAIGRSAKLADRAARVGFDWTDADHVLEALAGELAELAEARGDAAAEFHEWGDVALTLVNVARHLGIDPESSLRAASGRFEARFRTMETLTDTPLGELSSERLEALWERAKSTQ